MNTKRNDFIISALTEATSSEEIIAIIPAPASTLLTSANLSNIGDIEHYVSQFPSFEAFYDALEQHSSLRYHSTKCKATLNTIFKYFTNS